MPKATAIGALGALLAAAVVVSHLIVARPGTSWAVLLQQGAAGWSRPPSVTPLSRLWQKAPRDESGWGRLPQRHKPRVRHALPAPPAQHTRLSRELPSVYHLPAAQHPYAQVPAADRRAAQMLARNLARAHAGTVSGPHERPGQRARRRVSAARLRREERSLPPGYHVLQPGKRLPRGAKLVKALPLPAGYHVLKPGQQLPAGGEVVARPPQLAAAWRPEPASHWRRGRMSVPQVGAYSHMLDDEAGEEGGCDCEDGDEECECADEDAPRVANVTEAEPTAAERLQLADASHRASRVERIKARELKTQAAAMERDAVSLIQSGWSKHKEAAGAIEAAKSKEAEADEMVDNANKVLDLANAHQSESLAASMEKIASEFKEAAAEKAAKAEEYKAKAESLKAEQEEANAAAEGGEEEAPDGTGR